MVESEYCYSFHQYLSEVPLGDSLDLAEVLVDLREVVVVLDQVAVANRRSAKKLTSASGLRHQFHPGAEIHNYVEQAPATDALYRRV